MRVIQIELTNACPKRCSNCTRFCGHHEEPFYMDFETFKQAIDSMKGFKGIVGVMGGEPTIHPEFERFVKYYRDNWGYDDDSTALYAPSSDFTRHILANAYNTILSNQRGLWTSVTPRYYKHFELIQDTFGYQLVNDHTAPSMHRTLMVTRKELGIPDEEWFPMRDKCWVQNLWSASVTHKGAFFCEVAAAMDATLGGPGGWKVEPGWWKRTPADFGSQLDWCEKCSACLPMPSRDANGETDDVSPYWHEQLVQIRSPKLKKGLVDTFEPKAYDPKQHSINTDDMTPYLEDDEQRIGKARRVLLPQTVVSVAWLDRARGAEAEGILEKLAAAKRLDFVLSRDPAVGALAGAAGVPFVDASSSAGREVYAALKKRSGAKDWILLMRDCVPGQATLKLFDELVFNPGCYHHREEGGGALEFFNVRASALLDGGDLFDLLPSYAPKKVVELTSVEPKRYRLTHAGMLYRRAIKGLYWSRARVKRAVRNMRQPPASPAPNAPAGAAKGGSGAVE
jgi:hypothetical protein